jgi:hypothetical protein
MSPTSRRGWLRRWRFPILWTLTLIALVLGVNVYLALRPASIRAVIFQRLSAAFRVPVEVGNCSFGITRGIVIEGLRVQCPHHTVGAETRQFLEAPSIQVEPSYTALLMGEFRVREIVARQPKVFVHRAANGRWNLEGLVAAKTDDTPPPSVGIFRLESGTVTYVDEVTFGHTVSRVAEDVDLTWSQDRDGAVRVRADFAMDGIARVLLEGDLARDERGLQGTLRVAARKVDLRSHVGLLGRFEGLAALRRETVRGFVDADAEVRFESGQIQLQTVAGSLVGGSVAFTTAAATVDHLNCGFTYADGSVQVSEVKADIEQAHLTGAVGLRGVGDPAREGGWSARVQLAGVDLDERLLSWFPEQVREWVEKLRPSGMVSVALEVVSAKTFPPELDDCAITVRLDGVALRPPDFPYAFEDLRGELLIEDGRLTLPTPIRGTCPRLDAGTPRESNETTVQIVGAGIELVADGDLDLTAKVENVSLDERARSLLPPKGRPVWDQFQLLGTVDGTVTLTRSAARDGIPPGALRLTATALSDGGVRMNYAGFPYVISDISGKATFDSKTRRLIFIDLKGKHDSRIVLGDGVVQFGSPTQLRIDLHSDEVAVEPDLVAALPEKARRLLADFGVEGRLSADVSIHSTNDRGVEVATELQILEGAVQPTLFPYRLQLGAGTLKLLGAHTMEFVGVRTPEGYSPSVLFNGGLVSPGIERELNFKFEATRLPFDSKLTAALPTDLRSFAETLGLRGTFEGTIEGQYVFRDDDPSHFRILYHGEGIRTRDAEVDFGLKLRRMIGEGALVGRKEPDQPHYFLGKVLVESALFNRLELTNGEVQFTYGTEHEAIAAARAGGDAVESGYVPPPWLVARLQPETLRNTFQMLIHSADLYGGQVDGFGYVDAGEQYDLGGHLVGENLDLGLAAEDIFGVTGTDTEGTAAGTVTFTGRTGDLDSLRGEGQGTIKNARLVELPLFFGILSLLFGDSSERHYFREVLLSFGIEDGRFVAAANGVDIRSQALKLRGSGAMDFQGKLDLNLLPRFLTLEIPGVEQLFSLLKRGFAQILIRGTLNEPKVALATAGGLVEFDLDVSEDEAPPALPRDQRRTPRSGE